jgi:predicted  nucleic acid-binding Zn-ribbon protein
MDEGTIGLSSEIRQTRLIAVNLTKKTEHLQDGMKALKQDLAVTSTEIKDNLACVDEQVTETNVVVTQLSNGALGMSTSVA